MLSGGTGLTGNTEMELDLEDVLELVEELQLQTELSELLLLLSFNFFGRCFFVLIESFLSGFVCSLVECFRRFIDILLSAFLLLV